MSTQQTTRVVKIVVDASAAQSGSAQANRSLKSIQQTAREVQSSLETLKGAIVGLVGLESIRQLAAMADAFVNINSRLRLVLNSTEQVNQAHRDLLDLANRTRSDFGATVQMYNRVAMATDKMKLSHDQLLRVVEAVNLTFRISGSTTEEAKASALQFAQALGSGKLQGDELRSILENNQRMARVFADALGVSVGQLKKLGSQGQITSQALVLSLLQALPKLRVQVGSVSDTIGTSLVVLKNNFSNTVGAFAEKTGTVKALSSALLGLSDNLWIVGGALLAIAVTAVPRVISALRALTMAAIKNPFTALMVAASFAAAYIIENWDSVKVWWYSFINLDLPNFVDSMKIFALQMKAVFGDMANGVIAHQTTMYNKMAGLYNSLPGNVRRMLPVPGLPTVGDLTVDIGGANKRQQELQHQIDLRNKNFKPLHIDKPKPVEMPTGGFDETQDPTLGPGKKKAHKKTEAEKEADRVKSELERLRLQTMETNESELSIPTQMFYKAARTAKTKETGPYANQLKDATYQLYVAQQTKALTDWNRQEDLKLEKMDKENDAYTMTNRERQVFDSNLSYELELKQKLVGQSDEMAKKITTEMNKRKENAALLIQEQQAIARDPVMNAQKTLNQMYDDLTNSGQQIANFLNNSFKSIEDTMVNAFMTGKIAFGSMITSMLSDIARMVIRMEIIAPMVKALTTAINGYFGVPVSGARAEGGPVAAGSSYLVGERGPELFTPSSSGNITTNAKLANSGGSGVVNNVGITVNLQTGKTEAQTDSQTGADLGRKITAAVKAVLVDEMRPGGVLANRR